MPRNVRNFWIEVEVDGSKTAIATGPRRADGGFDIRIQMRDQGGIICPVSIHGRAEDDGRLHLTCDWNGKMQEPIVKRR